MAKKVLIPFVMIVVVVLAIAATPDGGDLIDSVLQSGEAIAAEALVTAESGLGGDPVTLTPETAVEVPVDDESPTPTVVPATETSVPSPTPTQVAGCFDACESWDRLMGYLALDNNYSSYHMEKWEFDQVYPGLDCIPYFQYPDGTAATCIDYERTVLCDYQCYATLAVFDVEGLVYTDLPWYMDGKGSYNYPEDILTNPVYHLGGYLPLVFSTNWAGTIDGSHSGDHGALLEAYACMGSPWPEWSVRSGLVEQTIGNLAWAWPVSVRTSQRTATHDHYYDENRVAYPEPEFFTYDISGKSLDLTDPSVECP